MFIAMLLKLIFDAQERQYKVDYQQGKKKQNMIDDYYGRLQWVSSTLAYLFI